jgi:hypothetical protein
LQDPRICIHLQGVESSILYTVGQFEGWYTSHLHLISLGNIQGHAQQDPDPGWPSSSIYTIVSSFVSSSWIFTSNPQKYLQK